MTATIESAAQIDTLNINEEQILDTLESKLVIEDDESSDCKSLAANTENSSTTNSSDKNANISELSGSLDAKQKKKLDKLAGKCSKPLDTLTAVRLSRVFIFFKNR